jgi:hypothetical protein
MAGWNPEYREYAVNAMVYAGPLKNWYGIAQRVMHNYEDELEVDLTL